MASLASSPLDPRQLAELRTTLESKRSELLAERQSRIDRVREPRTDLVGDEMDAAEVGAQAETLVREAAREEELLEKISHALERMDQGTYGLDESTGEPVSFERLRAVPWATEEVGTAELRERRR